MPHPQLVQYVELLQLVRARERRGEDPNGAAVEAQQLATLFSRDLERHLWSLALTGEVRSCLRGHALDLENLIAAKQYGRLGLRCRVCHRARLKRWLAEPAHRAAMAERLRRRRDRLRGRPAMTFAEMGERGRAAAAARWREIRELRQLAGNALEVV